MKPADRKDMDILHIYKDKEEKGQTLVETAIILLLILSLLFGITEFGRAWFYANALTNGVRAGTRYASTLSASTSFETNVRNFTFAQITTQGIPSNDYRGHVELINVSAMDPDTGAPIDFADVAAGDNVKVIVYYDVNILTGSIIPFFSGTKTITKQATMRYEGN